MYGFRIQFFLQSVWRFPVSVTGFCKVFQAKETLTVQLTAAHLQTCRLSPASSLFSNQNNVSLESSTASLLTSVIWGAGLLPKPSHLLLISPPSLPFCTLSPLTNTAFCCFLRLNLHFLPILDMCGGLCYMSWLSLPSCCICGQGACEPSGALLWDVEAASVPALGLLVSAVWPGSLGSSSSF